MTHEAIGRDGRRRTLGVGDFLRDGERLMVSVMAFDTAPPVAGISASQFAFEARIAAGRNAKPIAASAPVAISVAGISASQLAFEARIAAGRKSKDVYA